MRQSSEILTDKQKIQRKFLLILPLLILPFITFLLWSLGLIGVADAKATVAANGLNMQLPDAKLKENKSWDKLSFYEQADKDSARYQQAIKNDPFFNTAKDSAYALSNKVFNSPLVYNPLPPGYEDPNVYKVNQKLAQLNAVLNNNNREDKIDANPNAGMQRTPNIPSSDVNRLERMLQVINQPDSATDTETQQLNGIMDKILDIQHPERVAERIQQTSEKNKKFVFPVITSDGNNYLSLLEAPNAVSKTSSKKTGQGTKQNTFYSIISDTITEEKQNIIGAQIQEKQTVVAGSTVRMCLTTDVYVNGMLIPEGTFVYGTASQNAERLIIVINSIRYQNNLLPVALSVYDLDGIAGIYIPGSISRDVAKQTGNDAVNNLNVSSLDPSISMQAANVGIAAAKAIINKKVKQVKVTIKAGYKVMLKDNNQQ